MKKIFTGVLFLGLALASTAQQKEGKVTYERSSQMQISINGAGTEPITHNRTDRFELNFANNQMSWQQLPDDIQQNAGTLEGSGGIVIRNLAGGSDDLVFVDFNKERKVEAREFFDKKFLISDSIRRGHWKLSDETKTILGLPCRKATTERVSKRMSVQMENGKMERKEVNDTSEVIAWFTLSIPVPAGPDLQGQLPGLVLELEMNKGKTVYRAVEIKEKADKGSIKEPTKGKKVTPDEFATERTKMLEQMQQNNGGSIRFRAG